MSDNALGSVEAARGRVEKRGDQGANTAVNGVKRRGFASLTAERRLEIARMGGSSVPPEKRSFARDQDLAREAGRRGGINTHLNRTSRAD